MWQRLKEVENHGSNYADIPLKVFFDFATHIYTKPENAFIKINGNLIQRSKIEDWTSFTKEEVMTELTRKVEKIMELFLMLICYVLGAVVGYEIVKFLRVLWFLHKLGKTKKMLDEALDELNETLANQNEGELIEGTLEKSFNDLGKAMYTFGTSIQKSLDGKEEE